MKKAIIFIFCLIATSFSKADAFTTDQKTENDLRQLLEPLLKLQRERKLDGTLLLAKGSQQIFILDNSDDHLDLCQGIDGQYFLGSVGKQMMAVALLKVLYDNIKRDSDEARVNAVKAELNKPLITFLPSNSKVWRGSIPEWASQVTIHQLLSHRSGIPDFTRFPAFLNENSEGKRFEEQAHDAAVFLKIIEGAPLDFPPGTSEAYSNTGYLLIKEVIAEMTKMAPEDYMNQLFHHLKMYDTWAIKQGNWFSLRQQKETSCLLKPLEYDPTSASKALYLKKRLPDTGGHGPVQVVSTAIDLLKWNLALHRDHCCLPKGLYELMISAHSKGPSGYGYGYGIARDKTRFGIVLNHSSGSSRLIYIPSEEFSLILLTHVSYDWDLMEEMIQQKIKNQKSSTETKQEIEQAAIKEVFQQYPPENRGYDAINNILDQYLGIVKN